MPCYSRFATIYKCPTATASGTKCGISSGHWNWISRTCYSRLTAVTLVASSISHHIQTMPPDSQNSQ